MTESDSQQLGQASAKGRTSFWRRIAVFVERRLRILLFALYAVSGLSFAGRAHWLLDNLTAFVAQYAVIAFLFAVTFIVLRSPRWAAFAFVLAIAHMLRLWEPGAIPSAEGSTLTVISSNVKTSNREYERFLEFVRRESPDLLVVLEIDDAWAARLDELREEYPYSVIEPRGDNFGIALLSRVPLADAQSVMLGDASVPSIVARVALGEDAITILGTHPLPPVRSGPAAARNRQFTAIAGLASQETSEVLVLGDLNASPWSPHFRDLLEQGNLRDSRRGFDLQPTWPAFFPPMMTPIDHVLSSPGLAVTQRRVGRDIGSDHLPVLATIGHVANR